MRASHLLLLVAGPLIALAPGPAVSSSRAQTPPPIELPSAFVDVVALDSGGRQATSLTAADLRASIDGQPRRILSLRYVCRGSGAGAAARAMTVAGGTMVLVEPARTVLLVVDENSFPRGAEPDVVADVWRALDRLSPADRVALLALPAPRGQALLSTNREPLRAALAGLVGRGVAPRSGARADTMSLQGPDVGVSDEEPSERNRPGSFDPASARPSPPPEPAREPVAGAGAQVEPGGAPLTSWQALARVLSDLRDVPGPKSIVYFWGGSWGADPADPMRARDPRPDLAAVTEAAAASRTAIYTVSATRGRRVDSDAPLKQLARDTGGMFVKATSKGADAGALGIVLSGGYLVEVEPRESDRDGRVHALSIEAAHRGLTVLAARRWMPRDDPMPAPSVAPPVTPPEAPPATPRAAPRATKPADRPDPEVATALDRASTYLEAFLRDFSNVVAEEDYVQRVVAPWLSPRVTHLRSDFLLVRTSGAEGWIPFRDVFEVNGKAVRDREDRLRKLFLEKPDTAIAEGLRITLEGARYNIGSVQRTINLPTLALVFLMPEHLASFRFQRRRDTTMEDLTVWQLDYDEVGRPTVVLQAGTGRDMPSSGSIWLDPLTGRIVRTLVKTGDQWFRMEATVTYRRSEALGIWVPAEMKEAYQLVNGSEMTIGLATYSNYRRFQVSTQETVKIPK